MKNTIFFALFCVSFWSHAQVGINTTTPNAQLDIKSSNQATPANTDGILIPKIDVFPAINPTAAQQGMMVYLTTTVGPRTPGFYYWDNTSTSWIGVGSNTANAWGLSGNSGTTAGTNYVGTTDDQDVVFKRFNVTSGRIGTNNTSYGNNALASNSGSQLTAFGLNALQSNTSGSGNTAVGRNALLSNSTGASNTATGSSSMVSNTTGSSNTANGAGALIANTIGSENTAVGVSALVANIDGISNTSIGMESMLRNTSGNNNSAIGKFALANNISGSSNSALGRASLIDNTTGGFNTANGQSSLADNTTGSNNTATGYQALKANTVGSENTALGCLSDVGSSNLTNATAIGARAEVTVSNALVLGSINGVNGATNGVNVGIGTTAPADKLHVVGNIRMVDGNQAAGKVFTSDANGTGTWQNASTNAWGLTGNAGTNPATNFMGTSDDQDLVLKTNNIDNLRIKNDGRIEIGTKGFNPTYLNSTNIMKKLYIASETSTNNIVFQASNNISDPVSMYFGSSGGTLATPTISATNENISNIFFSGYDGAKFITSSSIRAGIDGTPGLNSMPGKLEFLTTPNSSDAPTTRMTIRSTGNVGIGTINPAERLHVVGNIRMVDGNQGAGKVLTSDANGTATWTSAGTLASGTLDQAYDFGGAGAGRTITADSGAVTIAGTDGLVATGTIGSGAVAPSGAGTRMVWNPNKAAFRVGNVTGTEWDDVNIGIGSIAFGNSPIASGNQSIAMGSSTASGGFSVALGTGNLASNGNSTAIGFSTTASGFRATTLGANTVASGFNSLAVGQQTVASGSNSTVMGTNNSALTFGETVLGIGATTYTPSVNGATQFRAANVTDRLFVVGNAIDANNNGTVDAGERSDALVILKNGNTGIGSSTPQDKLHVVGNIRMVDGNQAAGRVLTSNANGTATWTDAAANAWGLLGNSAVNAATNFMGSTNDADVVFRRFNVRAGFLGTTNTSLGTNSLDVAATGTNNTAIGVDALNNISTGTNNTAVGFNTLAAVNSGAFNTAIGAQATVTSTILTNATAIGSRATAGNSNVVILGSINGVNGATSSVNVGIGTNNPSSTLEIVDTNVVTSGTVEGILNVASNDPQNTDIGASITLSGIASGGAQRVFASVEGRKSNAGAASDSGYLSIKTNNVGTLAERIRITNVGDVGIGTAAPGGQFELSLNEGRKPGTNTWTIVSDQRLKTLNGNYTKGLNEILQLKPVRYNYKNNGSRTFEKEVLDTEFAGFLAQEVQPLFPEAVGTDDDGFLNFNIHPILIASVNALKELNAKNEQLEQKSSQLEKENQLLKESVQAINDKMLLIIAEMEKLKR